VETLAGDYDADEYEDDYQTAVEALVQAKLEGGEVKAPEAPKKSTGEVVDLLAALQRSVDAAKTSRGEPTAGNQESEAAEEEPAPEKTTASKSTAKKSTAKKSTTQKPTAKKPTAKTTEKAPAKKAAKKSTSRKTAAKKAS
jgi:DNA end-binding protein Ku